MSISRSAVRIPEPLLAMEEKLRARRVKMDNSKAIAKVFMYNALLRSVAFVCITVAAIWFERAGILWWYIVPALMGLSGKSD